MFMKKLDKKEVLTYILMFLGFFILSVYSYIYTTNLMDLEMFGFTSIKYHVLWIGFSISWVLVLYQL